MNKRINTNGMTKAEKLLTSGERRHNNIGKTKRKKINRNIMMLNFEQKCKNKNFYL